MTHDLDWAALHQLNFMLAPRISSPLNEALNALAIAEMGGEQIDSQQWREKARVRIANLLNLYQAWSAVIQHKNGLKLPQNAIRAFPVQSLLDWLTVQLELTPPAIAQDNLHLHGNQASIQEALLLLYSAATTQGTGVHLNLEQTEEGYWFRVRFSRSKPLPETLPDIIKQFDEHWRSQDSAFELKMAQDFVALNESEIKVSWNMYKRLGEFAFFVKKANVRASITTSPDVEHAKYVANIHRSMLTTDSEKVAEPSEQVADPQVEQQADSTESESMKDDTNTKGALLLRDLKKMDTDRLEQKPHLLPDEATTPIPVELLLKMVPPGEEDTIRVDVTNVPENIAPKAQAGNPPADPQEQTKI